MEIENQENSEQDEMLQSYIDDLQLDSVEEETNEEVVTETATEETTTEETTDVEKEEVVAEETAEEPVIEAPKAVEPDFKSDKDRWIYEKIKAGEDKEVYQKLKEKYEFENFSDEEKMLAFLGAKNPHLDREDLLFKAQDFGIGVEAIDEEDLTDNEKRELKRQEIERKGLLAEANQFFTDRQEAIELPTLANPLDADEDYKSYKERIKAEQEAQVETEKQITELNKNIDSTAKSLNQIGVEVKIENIDDGEFALQVQFDFDDKKKQQLADFAKVYTPTQAQIDARTDQNGEFDMKGYMTDLANTLFSKQILKAAIKQAIVKDRETFEARELKNSTLNNREVQQQAATELDYDSQLMAL